MTPAPRTALYEAEQAIAAEARATDRDTRRALAQRYRREETQMYIPLELLDTDDPENTWKIIRHLCRLLRAARREAWFMARGSVGTLRILITCELYVWRRQKDALAAVQYQRDMQDDLRVAAG